MMYVRIEKTEAKYRRWGIRMGWLGWNRSVGLGIQFWLCQPAVRLTVFGIEITGGKLARREAIRGKFGEDGWWEVDLPDRTYLDEVLARAQEKRKES